MIFLSHLVSYSLAGEVRSSASAMLDFVVKIYLHIKRLIKFCKD